MFAVGLKVLIIVGIASIVMAYPYPWGRHQSNYDASLDPIAWSRDFVKDSIRRPRQFRTHALLHNSLDKGEEEIVRKAHIAPSYSFGKRRSSKSNHANFTNSWYGEAPARKRNSLRNKFYRRRHKLDTRDRYGVV